MSDNEKALYPDDAQRGMAEMSRKFVDMGANVYVEADAVKASNKVL
jgi:phosphomethylpyrimidine synthase